MSAIPWLPAGVTKEVRALFPAWLACTAAVAAGGLVDRPQLVVAAMLAYGVGSVALGAQSIGHEYSHRTLGLLLSQPFDRRRLFITKTAVLGAMLLVLSVVAWTTVRTGAAVRLSVFHDPRMLLLVGLGGLFVAPYMTMICRNPLAAVVFTMCLPGVALVGGDLLGIAKYGLLGSEAEVDRLRMLFFWPAMFTICGAAAVASWIQFMRLEAIEGRGTALHLPRWWLRGDRQGLVRARPRHAIWLLVKKELRLQQMTFVLVVFCILGLALLLLLPRVVPEIAELPLVPVSILYLALMSILIGSLASAEEREFGTLEWQVLLPMSMRRQWAVKAGTALGLAVLLGVGVPVLLAVIHPSPEDKFRLPGEAVRGITMTVLVLTSGSLYLSSLCSSGVRAVVLSLPVMFGLFFFMQEASSVVTWALSSVPFGAVAQSLRPARLRVVLEALDWVLPVMLAGFTALLLRFAMSNHQSADRSMARVWPQLAWIAVYLAFAIVVVASVEALSWAG